MDYWLDLGQMDLESGQPSNANGLGQCQLIEEPSACKFEIHLMHL
jgi:hypothetical protein